MDKNDELNVKKIVYFQKKLCPLTNLLQACTFALCYQQLILSFSRIENIKQKMQKGEFQVRNINSMAEK